MNILVVCHYGLYEDLSASFVHGQTRAYAQLGHRVRVIVPLGMGKKGPDGNRFGPCVVCKQADGVELYYVRYATLSRYGKRWFNPAAARTAVRSALAKVLRDFAPDVIQAHTLGFDTQLGVWLKEKQHCPLVVTTHGSDASVPYEQGNLSFLRQNCDGADAVVAVSSALAEKVRVCGTKTPIHRILNGFHLEHVPTVCEKTPLTLMQVGHLLKQKRYHVTLNAFASLCAQYPGMQLEIVGHGPEHEQLQEQCRALGVAEAVQFAGQLPNAQVLNRLSKTQFFVMPSVREGFGIVYLEAMACGCITIGTQNEGIADLIRHGENGFLVPPDDPEAIVKVIQFCLKNPEEAARIAEAGRRDALRLTWQENAKHYETLFRELICCK